MSELTINEFKAKLTGIVNIPKELALTKDYTLLIKNVEVRKSEDIPNDDNTINRVFNLKLSEISELEIINEKGQVMKGRKKQTRSLVSR